MQDHLTEDELRAKRTAIHRRWVQKNKDHINEYKRTRQSDREKSKEWRRNNPAKIKEYKRADYQKNKEKYKQKNIEYREKNRERLKIARDARYRSEAGVRIREKHKLYIHDHPEEVRRWRNANRLRHRAKYLLYGIKKKCKNEGLEFNLTEAWLDARLQNGICEMSGLSFDMIAKRGANSPSVDRKNPTGGYTQENCRVILWFINRALSNYGEDYAISIFSKVIERRSMSVPELDLGDIIPGS
jgi:hypothetical protein